MLMDFVVVVILTVILIDFVWIVILTVMLMDFVWIVILTVILMDFVWIVILTVMLMDFVWIVILTVMLMDFILGCLSSNNRTEVFPHDVHPQNTYLDMSTEGFRIFCEDEPHTLQKFTTSVCSAGSKLSMIFFNDVE